MKHRTGIEYLWWQEITTTINRLNMYVSAVFDILTLKRQNSSSGRHPQSVSSTPAMAAIHLSSSLLSSVLDSKDSTPRLSNSTIVHSCKPDLSIYHTSQLISQLSGSRTLGFNPYSVLSTINSMNKFS